MPNRSLSVLSVLSVLLLVLSAALPAQAANSFASAGDAGQWIMNYYKNPEPARLADAVKVLSESEGISEDGQKLIVSFMGAALREASPQEQDDFFLAVATHEKARLFGLPAFWFMDNEAGRALIDRAGKKWKGTGVESLARQLASAPSPDLLGRPVQTVLHLDHLWSVFFATGKPEPVLKIIATLALMGDEMPSKHVIGQSAQWSLAANARTHPRVRKIMETALEAMSGSLKKRLATALEQH